MQKRTFVAALLAVLVAGLPAAFAGDTVIRLSEPVETSDSSETFGAPLDENLARVSLDELVENADEFVGKSFVTSVRVSQVCQKKGCFFIAKDGATTLRVSFKDYGFFVPTDSAGKQVMLTGELVEKTLSEEQVEHFAEDLGESRETVARLPVYEIVATSVRVPRSPDADG
ncbi:MAG: DUF4920 domain-containing protein [Woeseiaceae bacterium]|nr:DUF4920 domain-containing protein [Woeseiaceae bacterium]